MKKLNIGIIKGILFLAVLLIGFFPMKGEEKEETRAKMMEIKLNDDFIFGEGVSDDKEIAYGVAMDDLLIFANEIKDRNSQEKLSMSDLVTKAQTLVYEDGSRYEVIVYIPFKIVIETDRKDSSARSGVVLTKPGIVFEETEEPEIEIAEVSPVAEVVPVEEKEMDAEPVPEVKEESTIEPVPEVKEEIVAEVAPVVTEATPDKETTPVVEEVAVVEKTPSKEEIPQPVVAQETPKTVETKSNVSPAYSGEIEDFLISQDNFSEIKPFLSEMKRSGKISETGATDSLSGLPQDAALVLMDEFGGILAVLSPANPQGRTNYRTHKADSENNYNSKFILWYKK